MKQIITALFLTTLLAACSQNGSDTTPEPPHSEAITLNSWLNEAYDARLQLSPLTLASLGRKERYGEFDDVSAEGQQAALDIYRQQIASMQEVFEYSELSPQEQLRYDYYIYLYERAVAEAEFSDHVFVFNQMDGVHTNYPQQVMTYHEISSKQDALDYVSRVSGMAEALRFKLDQAKANAANNVRPPQFAYELVISESQSLISGQPFDQSNTDSPLFDHAQKALNELISQSELSSDEADAIRSALTQVLLNELLPVYSDIIAFAQAELEFATPTAVSSGIGNTPRAAEYYAMLLKSFTTTDLSAEEIHQIGLDEVARLTIEMEQLKESVGFEGTLVEFFDYIQTDERFFYPNTDEGRQAYLDDSTNYINDLLERAPEFFSRLPNTPLEVRRVEAYREQPGAPQHYSPGFADGSKPGTYYAHLIDMNSMPKSEMEAIAYHEGVPGHHFDWALTAENPDIPVFQSTHYIAFHSEGWALYSELLSKEMGGYQNPYNDFGRLMTEMWRAIRLVVDTGLHHYGWTEAQAIDYMLSNNPIAPGAAVAEIHRYQVIPGQATSYKIGMLKILELREKARVALGEQFDIRGFHDAILVQGALPAALLERRVDLWIESVKAR